MKGLGVQEVAKRLKNNVLDNRKITLYFIDSRESVPGGLFFALKGERADGHHFLGEVAEKGAIAAVVSKTYGGPDFGLSLIRVADVLGSLQSLARELLEERKVVIAGVTGSVGKTTTKDFLWTLLQGKYHAAKSPFNKNSQASLPINLLNLEGKEELLVLEMGMNHKGELKQLVTIAPPDYALITNVDFVHAEFFPEGLEGIAEAKMEIFSSSQTKAALIPYDLLCYQKQLAKYSLLKKTFSLIDRRADFFLERDKEQYNLIENGKRSSSFTLPFQETQFIYNVAAAISFCRLIGLSYEEIFSRLKELSAPKMRFEKIEKDGKLFINDAYNAAPLSVRTALSELPEPKKRGRRIAVLGDMKELGNIVDVEHLKMGKFALPFIDYLFGLGEKSSLICDEFRKGGKKAEHFLEKELLAERLREFIQEGDVILIKGSRSLKMEKLFEYLGMV